MSTDLKELKCQRAKLEAKISKLQKRRDDLLRLEGFERARQAAAEKERHRG